MSEVIGAIGGPHMAQSRVLTTVDERPELCATGRAAEKIFVVEDDYFAREGICSLLRDGGWEVEAFSSCEDFLIVHQDRPNTCVVLDLHFAGMSGLELLDHLAGAPNSPPVIVVSGSSGIADAVQSMKQGAVDFLEKPVERDVLLASVGQALGRLRRFDRIAESRNAALSHLTGLTPRQHQIMDLVLAGQPSKNIAADLGISRRTVENHRASIMQKTGSRSLPTLAQQVMCKSCALDR